MNNNSKKELIALIESITNQKIINYLIYVIKALQKKWEKI